MASHVVIVDSTARRTTIKTTPSKHLSDILEEGCTKLGLDSTLYGLKHNNKPVDLSRTVRLAGLSAGAKLELIQTSRSVGVVSVALQLPETEFKGTPNIRLTHKFPSRTTLWLVLRKFEAGVAGGSGTQLNITARGIAATSTGTSGAGRLYYQQPVLQIMNRELSSFSDFQKTLAQIGLNSGSALLRLSFRTTTIPLEEAMTQIQKYFNSSGNSSVSSEAVPSSTPDGDNQTQQPQSLTSLPESGQASSTNQQNESQRDGDDVEPESRQDISDQSNTRTSRPVSVFRPPSSSTPLAARTSHNPDDYTPTVEHAQNHQRMLSQSSRNIRLPTEAEIAAQAAADAEKLAAIKDVEIKIRFPDQSAISAKFKQSDSASDLYQFIRECLVEDLKPEPFLLRNSGVRGRTEVIPDDSRKKLIKDLSLKGRVLIIFSWDDTKASGKARGTKSILREDLKAQAMDVKIPDIPDVQDDKGDPGVKVNLSKDEQSGAGDTSEGKKKLPKWLNRLSKK